MFKYLIIWSLHNRTLVLAITIAFTIFGGYCLQQMPVDVFPEFAPPQVVIQTQAPGMAPEEVEAVITFPLETIINGTPGVTSVRSKTTTGLSTITIIFDEKTNIYLNRQLINERVQQIVSQLPPGVKPPVIHPVISAVGWLVKYALTSETVSPEDLRTISDWVIRPRVLSIGGVASVVSIGGEVKQYQVLLDPLRMQAYGITVSEVRAALEKANQNVPGAFLDLSGTELLIRSMGRVKTLKDLTETVVTTRNGVSITINNIAKVRFGGEIKRGDAAYNLENAVIGTISKTYGADTLKTTYKVEKALEAIRATLPAGVKLDTTVFRQANFIESAISNLTHALLQGAFIVVIILFIFLMNLRASLITFISMPLSFVVGVLILYFFGLGINAMTLGGIAIAIGEVVDDGIITVENVVHRLRLNRLLAHPRPSIRVIFDAVLEIRNSVVYATMIICLVFLPIFFLTGISERIFSPLAIAYIASVLGSLIISITTVPVLCYLLLVRKDEKLNDEEVNLLKDNTLYKKLINEEVDIESSDADRETRFVSALKRHFLPILKWSVRHFRYVVVFALGALIFAISLLPFFSTSFLPEFHEGNFIIAMATLPGNSLDESMRIGYQVRKLLLKHPQVLSVSQRAGRSDIDEDGNPPNMSEFDVKLDFDKGNDIDPKDLVQQIRAELATIPGANFNVSQFIAHRMDEVLSGVRYQVAIKVFGENLTTLNNLGQSIEGILRTIPDVVDINKEQQINVPQLLIKIDREKAIQYGIDLGQLSENIQILLNGLTVSSVLEGQRSFSLYLRMNEPGRENIKDVQNMLIDTRRGNEGSNIKIPLNAIATISKLPQPFAINRENVQRLLIIGFNIQGNDLGAIIEQVQTAVNEKIKLPSGYYINYGGQFESQQAAFKTITWLGLLAIFAMLILLHKAFGSFGQAFLVLLNLPLALIGGVISLFIASGDMSTASMIGFIMLFGIATRNGIILISHFGQLKAAGQPLPKIIIQGTLDRLVPVLMTASAASLGLIPLLLGSPVGKELERPLAQVLLGGLFTSTLLNLIVIPSAYNAIEKWREKRYRKNGTE